MDAARIIYRRLTHDSTDEALNAAMQDLFDRDLHIQELALDYIQAVDDESDAVDVVTRLLRLRRALTNALPDAFGDLVDTIDFWVEYPHPLYDTDKEEEQR